MNTTSLKSVNVKVSQICLNNYNDNNQSERNFYQKLTNYINE